MFNKIIITGCPLKTRTSKTHVASTPDSITILQNIPLLNYTFLLACLSRDKAEKVDLFPCCFKPNLWHVIHIYRMSATGVKRSNIHKAVLLVSPVLCYTLRLWQTFCSWHEVFVLNNMDVVLDVAVWMLNLSAFGNRVRNRARPSEQMRGKREKGVYKWRGKKRQG